MTHVGIRVAVDTDPGRHRDVNEDSAYVSPRLIAVADGMGGHVHGEIASATVIAALSDLDGGLLGRLPSADGVNGAESADGVEGVDLAAVLAGAVTDACERLADVAERNPSLRGMGTTLTAMLWDGGRFALAHVGDSRGYRLRDGELTQLTTDHTMVQSLVDEGRMLPQQALAHPRRSMLTRALQTGGTAEPDLSEQDARQGDRYLLCSDGLTDVLPPDLLGEVLASDEDPADPDAVVRTLIELANEGGGPDNITCVLADVLDGPAPDPGRRMIGAAAQLNAQP